MKDKDNGELEDLNTQIEKEEDPEKKQWLQFMVDMVAGKKTKNARVLKEVQEIDKHLRTAMTMVLNFYAENEGQFNQKLLENVAELIIKRSKKVKLLK
jgi:hypothetical protein